MTLQCRLSDFDRRTPLADFSPIELVDAPGIDYFENLCLVTESTCADQRTFSPPRVSQLVSQACRVIKSNKSY